MPWLADTYQEAWVIRKVFGLLSLFLVVICQPGAAQNAPAQPSQRPPDTIEERVRACASCHGEKGQGVNNVNFPRLAGKPAGYLYNQLVAFREGRRKYAPMNFLLAYLPDEFLDRMARYYADLRIPYNNPAPSNASQDILQRGRNLALQGDSKRQIPACVRCHGPNFGGREPGIPALIGLHADYISAQLGAWRYGTRTAREPDCMQLIAGRLTEAEVAAVSAWLSSNPIPADTHPLPRSSEQLPLACGSQKP